MQRLGELLTELLRQRPTLARKMQQHSIWDRWEEVVGDKIAAAAVPVRMKGTTLVIGVSNSTWMQELTYLKPELLAKIQKAIGPELIADIRCELAP
ncbi:MAG: DUF721 domain-containing protein [Deltaproteobacteria bacterium]|nr:DUF721 domain-containing protein [Deltaproteobacteria bacterium]